MTLIQFDVDSGARISGVVRYVEAEANKRRPLNFEAAMSASQQKLFRICTFTGSWSINSGKTVTLKFQSLTPNTVVATNIFANITATGTRNCAIAKEGTAWFLIAAEC